MRPHVLGIDDGPFRKKDGGDVPVVGVIMEGATLVEGIALTRFPVDGDDATEFLADWIGGLRSTPALQAVALGGITIAGLGIVDITALASRLDLPVLSVTRRDTSTSDLANSPSETGKGKPGMVCAPPIRISTTTFSLILFETVLLMERVLPTKWLV